MEAIVALFRLFKGENTQNFLNIGSFARLFAKLPQPGACEVTFAVFELSCHPIPTSLTIQS